MVTTPTSERLASWITGTGPTVASVLRRGYVEYRGLLAVVGVSGESTSHHELDRAVRLLVTGPRSHGAAKGDRVVLHTKNRSECFTSDHALAIGGFVRFALSGNSYSGLRSRSVHRDQAPREVVSKMKQIRIRPQGRRREPWWSWIDTRTPSGRVLPY